MSVSENLMNARCRLIVTNPFYGSMASGVVWRASKDTPTMGVRIDRGGEIEALYNTEWCEKLKIEQMMAVVQHEIEHIVRLHCHRIGSDREPMLWNVAADAIVNGRERSPRVDGLPTFEDGADGAKCFYLPDDVDEKIGTEELYDHLDKKRIKIKVDCPMCGGTGTVGGSGGGDQGDGDGKDKKGKKKGKGKGDGDEKDEKDEKDGRGGGGSGFPCPMCGGKHSHSGKGGMTGKWVDDHSIWGQSTVSKDEARQIIKERVESAVKTAGTVPGHLTEAIRELEKAIINWKYIFRQMLGRKCGGHRSTFSRRSRRYNQFGVPGKSTHAATPLTVCVDTSGSMSSKDLERVFAEIESMSQKFRITLIQFDHGVQVCQKYHRQDWRKIKLQGRGGTSFIELFKWMTENRMWGEEQVILTDGYAEWPQPEPFHVIWAIINEARSAPDQRCPWGETVAVVAK